MEESNTKYAFAIAVVFLLCCLLLISLFAIKNQNETRVLHHKDKIMCFDDWKCDSMKMWNTDAEKKSYPCRTQNKVPLLSCLLKKGNGVNENNLKCEIDKPVNCMQGCKLTPSVASTCCCNTKNLTFCSKNAKCENSTSGSNEKESQKEKHSDKGSDTHHRKHSSRGNRLEREILVRTKRPNKGKCPDKIMGLSQGNVSNKDRLPTELTEIKHETEQDGRDRHGKYTTPATETKFRVVPRRNKYVTIANELAAMKDDTVPVENHVIPIEKDIVPIEKDIVPMKSDKVSIKHDKVPIKHDTVPIEKEVAAMKYDSVPIKNYVVPIEKDIVPIEKDTVAIKTDIVPMKSDTVSIKNGIVPIENDVVAIEKDVVGNSISIKNDAVPIEKDMLAMKKDVVPIKSNNVSIENDTVPIQKDIVAIEKNVVPIGKDVVSIAKDVVPTGKNVVSIENNPIGSGVTKTIIPKRKTLKRCKCIETHI